MFMLLKVFFYLRSSYERVCIYVQVMDVFVSMFKLWTCLYLCSSYRRVCIYVQVMDVFVSMFKLWTCSCF